VQDNRTVQSTAGNFYHLNCFPILVLFALDGLNDVASPMQNIQNPSNVSLLPFNHLSITTQVTPIVHAPTSPQFSYAQPEIIIQPKEEWHLRYMRDVGTREMSFLSGDGSQRTPIRVKVSYYFYLKEGR